MVSILKIRPERSFGTVFKDDAVVRIAGNCSQEHDDMRVSDSFHGMALAQEISQADISILNFEFFDNNRYFSPSRFINNTISSLANLILYL